MKNVCSCEYGREYLLLVYGVGVGDEVGHEPVPPLRLQPQLLLLLSIYNIRLSWIFFECLRHLAVPKKILNTRL